MYSIHIIQQFPITKITIITITEKKLQLTQNKEGNNKTKQRRDKLITRQKETNKKIMYNS